MAAISDSVRSGSCLCGSIRYELTGAPSKKVLCHCQNCKKATGSCFMMNEGYSKSELHITQGEDNIKTYHDDQTASGDPLDRSFCSNCGSPLFVTNSKAKNMVIVTVGTQDRVRDWRPQEEYYYAKRMEWLPNIEGSVHMETM